MNIQNLISSFLRSDVSNSMGWILLNSLWQILLLSFLYYLFKIFVTSARARYHCATALLGLLIAMVLTTPFFEPKTETIAEAEEKPSTSPTKDQANRDFDSLSSPVILGNQTPGMGQIKSSAPSSVPSISPKNDFGESVVVPVDWKSTQVPAPRESTIPNHYRGYLPYLVLVWLGGLVLFALRPLYGFFYAARIRKTGVQSVENSLQQRCRELAQQMGIQKSVRLIQSGLIKVPMVIGYFRPVIVFPLAICTQFSTAEIDAILRHELAHIRRHDVLVNLFQSLLETLFFFHPCLWWLSNQIRIEREHCCDDLAAPNSAQALQLANALFHLEESRVTTTGIAATDGDLQSRIKRLVMQKQKSKTTLGKRLGTAIFASLVVIAISITAVAASTTHQTGGTDSKDIQSVTLKSVGDSFSWSVLRSKDAGTVDKIVKHFPGLDSGQRGADPAGYEINIQIVFEMANEKKIVVGLNTDLGLWNRGNGDFLMKNRLEFLKSVGELAKTQSNSTQKPVAQKQDNNKLPNSTVKLKGSSSPVEIQFDKETGTMIFKGKAEEVKRLTGFMNSYLEKQKTTNSATANETDLNVDLDMSLTLLKQKLARAEQKMAHTRKLYEKGYVNKQQLQIDEFEVNKLSTQISSVSQQIDTEKQRARGQAERLKKQLEFDREIRLSQLSVAEAAMAAAKLDFDRAKQLSSKKLISRAELQKFQLDFERTRSDLEILQLKLKKIDTELKGLESGKTTPEKAEPKTSKAQKAPTQLDLQIMAAELKFAEKQLEITEEKLRYAQLQRRDGQLDHAATLQATLDVEKRRSELQILHLKYKNAKESARSGAEKRPEKDAQNRRDILLVELEMARKTYEVSREQLELITQKYNAGDAVQSELLAANQQVLEAEKNIRLLELTLKAMTPPRKGKASAPGDTKKTASEKVKKSNNKNQTKKQQSQDGNEKEVHLNNHFRSIGLRAVEYIGDPQNFERVLVNRLDEKLEELIFPEIRGLTDEDVETFSRFKSLKVLRIGFGEKLTTRSLNTLTQLQDLRLIDVSYCPQLCSDAAMEKLATLPKLEAILMMRHSDGGCSLKTLESLKKMKSLKQIWLTRQHPLAKTIENLDRKRPMADKCYVVNDAPNLERFHQARGLINDQKRHRIFGKVTDTSGKGVPGATIRMATGWGTLLGGGSTQTDAQGYYQLDFGEGGFSRDPALQVAWCFVSHEKLIYQSNSRNFPLNMAMSRQTVPAENMKKTGFAPNALIVQDNPVQLDFVLAEPATVRVKLMDKNGNPLKGQELKVDETQQTSLASSRQRTRDETIAMALATHHPWTLSVPFKTKFRTQSPVMNFDAPGEYRIIAQLLNRGKDTQTLTILDVQKDGQSVKSKTVTPSPFAKTPIDDQATLDDINEVLKKVHRANQTWLEANLRDKDTKVLIDIFRDGRSSKLNNLAPSQVRPVFVSTFDSVFDSKANVLFHEKSDNGKAIRVSYSLAQPLRYSAGNGIQGKYKGYFSTNVLRGQIEIDRENLQILKHDLGEITETFSNYVSDGGQGHVPTRVQIRRNGFQFDWHYQVVEGIWILKEIPSQDLEVRVNAFSKEWIKFHQQSQENPNLAIRAELLPGDDIYMEANLFIKNTSDTPQTFWRPRSGTKPGIFVAAQNEMNQPIPIAKPSSKIEGNQGARIITGFEKNMNEKVLQPGKQVKIYHRFSIQDLWPETQDDLPSKVQFHYLYPPMKTGWIQLKKPNLHLPSCQVSERRPED